MPHSPELIEKRNAFILKRFRHHKRKNPKWDIIHVISEVADDVFLEPSTVAKVLKSSSVKVPAAQTVTTRIKQHAEETAA